MLTFLEIAGGERISRVTWKALTVWRVTDNATVGIFSAGPGTRIPTLLINAR